jgi:diguanylate cyclase (GGDEF)-like protein/PAS domain S-box-containing protein
MSSTATGASRRRLRTVAVLIVALVVGAVALSLGAVLTSARRADAVTNLQDARADMHALSQLEWQAVAEKGVSAELAEQVRKRRTTFRSTVGGLGLHRSGDQSVHRVAVLGDRYVAAYDEEIRLLLAGDFEAAEKVDETRVDPTYLRLEEAFARAIATSHRAADRSLIIASVGAATLVPLAALGALWLLRREGRTDAAREIERAAQASAQRFEAMVRGASDLVVVTGTDGGVTYASPAARRMLGCDAADLLGGGLNRRIHLADMPVLHEAIREVRLAQDQETTVEIRALHSDGSSRTLECRLHDSTHDEGVAGIVWNVRDVTERRALEGQLTHQAFHDALTGLANRALLTDRLGQALPRALRTRSGVGVVILDLDGFKDVNDSLGHGAGDQVISVSATRLQKAVRLGDTVARFGGDEFVLLLEELSSERVALEVAERAVALLSEPTRVSGRLVQLTASAGVACISGARLSNPDAVEAIVRDADVAMYTAKERGKGRAVVFEDAMRADAQDRLDLIVDIRSAVAKGEIRVVYQPVLDLERERVVGFEALARWHHPTRGVISPASFVPLAEESLAILDIGRYVLREACEQVAVWNRLGDRGVPLEMSVNLSGRQLADPALVSDVSAVLAESGLSPSLLVLEITESAVVEDLAVASGRLRELRAIGVRIAMDDFGTGYSSLSYLRRLPIDILKIDKSFLGDQGGVGPELLAGVASLGATLGLTTVAEGIESSHQLDQVLAAGCTQGQGFLFARPLAPEAVGAYLRQERPELAATEPQAPGVETARAAHVPVLD